MAIPLPSHLQYSLALPHPHWPLSVVSLPRPLSTSALAGSLTSASLCRPTPTTLSPTAWPAPLHQLPSAISLPHPLAHSLASSLPSASLCCLPPMTPVSYGSAGPSASASLSRLTSMTPVSYGMAGSLSSASLSPSLSYSFGQPLCISLPLAVSLPQPLSPAAWPALIARTPVQCVLSLCTCPQSRQSRVPALLPSLLSSPLPCG